LNDAPIPQSLERVALWRSPASFQYLEADLSFRATHAVGKLSIHSDFLTEIYPAHSTLGHVVSDGRADPFTFQSAATFNRRIGSSRAAPAATAAAGVAVLGLLLFLRRRSAAAAVAMMLVATAAQADIVMSAPALNATLKTMDKLKRQTDTADPRARADAWFFLAAEADGLASLMNLEVESHGMQERELLDLALGRTKELGVAIAYNRDKKKFFYDGAGFAEYLKEAPRGSHAAAAEFKLLSYQFYTSSAADTSALTAAADAKKRFLLKYPTFAENAELRLYLAVDYRDLHARYIESQNAEEAAKYSRLARAECLRIVRRYPRSEQADAARQLLQKLR
jgi:hypothetical protein